MKLMLSVSRLSIAAAAALLLTTGPVMAQAIGVNAAIRNQVRIKTAKDTGLRPAVLRETVSLGDAASTGPASGLQVLLRDKSTFTLGANAKMTFDRFVYDPNRGTSEVAASVAKGAFRFMSGKTQANARKTINTPVASIGVRGTIVEGVVGSDVLDVLAGEPGLPDFSADPEAVALVVLRGPSRKTSGFDRPGLIDVTAGGETVPVEYPGEAVLVFGGKVYGPFKLSDVAFERLAELLRPTPSGPSDGLGGDTGSVGVASGDTLSGNDTGSVGGSDDFVFDPGPGVDMPPESDNRFDDFPDDGPNDPGPGGPNDNPGGPGSNAP